MTFKLMAGEMAKLRDISKQTLIYYDKIELFQPCEIDPETGYRYYTLEQIDELDIILCLKRIGLSLKEIKAYLKIDTTPARIKALEEQKKVLMAKVENIQKTVMRLDSMISTHKNSLSITPFDMGIRWQEEIPIITEPVPAPNDQYAMDMAFIKFFQNAQNQYNAEVQDIVGFVESTKPKNEKFLKIGLLREGEAGETIPAGYYAYIYHKGAFETIEASWQKLSSHIRERGYQATGPSIGRLLLSTLLAVSEAEYLLELSVPVEKLK